MNQSDGRTGLGLAVLASAAFGTSGSFAASLIDAGWSPAGAVLARVSLAAVVLTIPAIISLRGRWGQLRRSAALIAIFGLVAVAACQVFYFNAVSRLSVGVALLLEYLGVVLVVLWLWVRHGQRPRRLTVAGAVTSIIGLVLVLNLTGSHRLDPIGVMWGLLAAVGLADLLHPVRAHRRPAAADRAGLGRHDRRRRRAGRSRPRPGSSSCARRPPTCASPATRSASWCRSSGWSLLAGAFAYVASIGASRRLGAKLASFVGLTEVLFAVLFAWILLGQLPGFMQLAGGLFIVGGVVLVRIDELRAPADPEPATEPATADLAWASETITG